MADAIVSFVVEELFAMAKDEVDLLLGVKKEVRKLSSTFTAIQACLEDAERQQVTEVRVRDWLGKLKEVAYEVEDVIDEWRTDAFRSQLEDEDGILNRKKVRSCSCFPSLCFKQVGLRHDIGHRIREITDRINEISVEKSRFEFKEYNKTEEVESKAKKGNRETSSFFDESEIVGRDEEKGNIINDLVNETSQEEKPISIVSIVGMGGLGKTTLAQLVYNDESVQKHFEKRIWVCVSDPFNVNTVATKIIQSMGGSTSENQDLDTLQGNLREAVGKMRFLLVLDDVWDESGTQWEKLRLPLKGAARGSKIVITTRSHDVAKVMGTTHPHSLEHLPDSDCLKLFKSRALKGIVDEECIQLMKVGEKIVERCKGVPLAIQTVGSLLSRKKELWYWTHILTSEIWEWKPQDERGILPALLLSYHSLPLHLKRCFPFCSLFPKDHEIKKDELVQLWIAHGLIKSEREEIEEIGEMYFDDLLTLSLFQEVREADDGNIVCCKVHDLVHDLAMFVATGDYCYMEIGNSKLHSVTFHHLTLDLNYEKEIPSPLCNAERLRTLLLWGSSYIEAVPDSLCKHMRFLRALDLSDTCIEDLPCLIGKLKHLRYLNLCNLNIKEVPEFVTDLCNLQTLKLNDCTSLCTLPSGMSKMVKLRHLEIKNTTSLEFLPNGLGRLTSLRSLCKFPLGDENKGCKIGELKNLNLLKGKLEILNLERVMDCEEANKAELNKKCNLQSLSLHYKLKTDEQWIMLGAVEIKTMESVLEALIPPHSNLKELKILQYPGSKFPSWLGDSMFSNLVEVTLAGCKECRLLPGLGKLPSLKYLKIYGADEVKVVENEFYGNDDDSVKGRVLPKLEELYFDSMSNWEEWRLTEEHGVVMPSLKTLNVSNCHKLKAWPCILPYTLKKVAICNCEEVIWMQCNPLPLLEYLSLPVYQSGIFSKSVPRLPALKTLYIEGKCYESLSSDGWGLLESLHTLYISNSHKLTYVPDGLGQLKALRTLKIDTCPRLSSLPEGLGQLKVLHTLKIYRCPELLSLPEGLGQLTALQTLEIVDCSQLSSLPEVLGQQTALQTLEIVDCSQLSSLPERLGQLKSLQTLKILSCSQLSSLPEGFGQLKALQTLRIYNCSQLSSLPEGLGELKALQTLEIWYCSQLSSLPEGLGQLKALQTLRIYDCFQLSSLPEGLGQLKALQSLKILSCSQLSSLPKGLGQLKALRTLEILRCSSLSSLPEVLGQLTALRTLQISNCSQLSSLPEGLGQLKALQILDIRACNGLTSIPNGLGQLKSLRHLQVFECPNLKPLPNLQNLTMLEEIGIADCPLVTERLEKEKGADWCNISHIPSIWIDHQEIQ